MAIPANVVILRRLSPGLLYISVAGHAPQLWSAVKVRRTRCGKRCIVCHRILSPGEVAFRPLGNPMNRMDRICQACGDTAKEIS